jgi:hypothetical protein
LTEHLLRVTIARLQLSCVEGRIMKAMWMGFLGVVAIAALAGIVLSQAHLSTAELYSSGSTRLN